VPRRPFRILLESTWRSRARSWLNYARHLVGNEADAEDLVQDAVYKSLRVDPDLNNEREASSYVRSAIQRGAQRLVGKRRRLTHAGTIPATEVREQQVWESPYLLILSKEEADETEELIGRARKYLAALSEDKRVAIELAILREPPKTLREIAEIQGVAISTVHERVRRGLRALAEAFANRTESDVDRDTSRT